MSNLTVRLISAAAMIVILYGGLVASEGSRWFVIAALLALGAWEFARMITGKFRGPASPVGPAPAWFAGALVFTYCIPHYPGLLDGSASLAASPDAWLWGLSILAVVGFTLIGFRKLDITVMAPWIYLQIFGCAYFGVYASAIFGLVVEPVPGWRGIFPLLMVQIAIAAADAGAYFTGRKFGKTKLAPSISSGKTREGAYGGAALTVLITVLLGPKLLHTGLLANLGLGLLMAGAAIIGDLFISILKRYTGTKDSSQLIPGHGGILDRFDALIFAAPVAVFYLQLVRG